MPNRNYIDRVVEKAGTLTRKWSDGRLYNIATVETRTTDSYITSVTPEYWKKRKMKTPIGNRDIHRKIEVIKPMRGAFKYVDSRSPDSVYPDCDESGVFNGTVSAPGSYSGIETLDWVSLDWRAKEKLLAACKGQTVNLAVAFGERNQTGSLIATTARRIAQSLNHLKRGQFSKAASALGVTVTKELESKVQIFERKYVRLPSGEWAYRTKEVRRRRRQARRAKAAPQVLNPHKLDQELSSIWLELQYGWKPLLMDVYGSCEHAAKRRPPHYAVDGVAKDTVKKTTPENSTYWTKSSQSEVSGQVKYSAVIQIVDDALKEMTELGITNPALVAWELLPYSFVVDWFVPIGNWVSSWDSTIAIRFDHGYYSKVTRCWVTTAVTGKGNTGGTISYSGSGTASAWMFSLWGYNLGGLPSLPFPDFKNPFSASHVTSALALLTQAVHR